MRIVIYGAAGRIGMALVRHLSSEHDVRGVDLLAPESASDGFVVGDVRDPGLFRATLTGADASVYLPFAHYDLGIDACNATSAASFDINLRRLFYFLAAAREHGVQRLVFTSSLEVFGGTWEHDTLDETTPTTPRNVYGLTKTLAEETCRFFARRHAMNVVVLRLCGVLTAELWMNHGPKLLQKRRAMRASEAASHSDDWPRTHVDDAVEAIRLTLAGGLRGFQLFHVIGEHGVQAWSTEASREQLGFIPRYRTLGES